MRRQGGQWELRDGQALCCCCRCRPKSLSTALRPRSRRVNRAHNPAPTLTVDAVVAVVFGRVIGLRAQMGRTASLTVIRESQIHKLVCSMDERSSPSSSSSPPIQCSCHGNLRSMMMIGFTSHRDAGKMCLFLSYQWRSTTCRNRRQKP